MKAAVDSLIRVTQRCRVLTYPSGSLDVNKISATFRIAIWKVASIRKKRKTLIRVILFAPFECAIVHGLRLSQREECFILIYFLNSVYVLFWYWYARIRELSSCKFFFGLLSIIRFAFYECISSRNADHCTVVRSKD